MSIFTLLGLRGPAHSLQVANIIGALLQEKPGSHPSPAGSLADLPKTFLPYFEFHITGEFSPLE